MRIVRQGLTRTQQKLLPVTTAMLERSQKRQLKYAPPVPQGCTLVPLGPVNVPRAVREARQRDKLGRLCALLVLQGRLPITKTAVEPVLYVSLGVTATLLVRFVLAKLVGKILLINYWNAFHLAGCLKVMIGYHDKN